jgi:hypothetical protein
MEFDLAVLMAGVLGFCSPEQQDEALEIRKKTVEALQAFQTVEKPEISKQFPMDEHVGRSLGRRFVASRETALIARAWTGDPGALDEIEKKLDLLFKDPVQREQRSAMVYQGFQFFTEDPELRPGHPNFLLLLGALDLRRPGLAGRLRQEVLSARRTIGPERRLGVVRDQRERERYREAMRLKPGETEAQLAAILKDEKEDINRQCAAAYGLAAAGKSEGLNWLQSACGRNLGLGGTPALNLIESGEGGEQAYVQMLLKLDGPDLPYPFQYSIGECRPDLFWKHLEKFIFLKNDAARFAAYRKIQSQPIPEKSFDGLIGIADPSRVECADLVDATVWSLGYHGVQTPAMRGAASIWMDQLLARGERFLPGIAEAFLKAHLGTPQIVAQAARKQLAGPSCSPQAFDVLAEAGNIRDVSLIWKWLQQKREDPAFELRSRAWLMICRLTASLAD